MSGHGTGASAWLPLGAEMPKKAGVINRGKNQSKEPGRPLPPLGPVVIDPTCCVAVAIHAKPGSKQNALTDVMAEAVSVVIAALSPQPCQKERLMPSSVGTLECPGAQGE